MKIMERFNPVLKMGTMLVSAVLLMFNQAILLNLIVFAVSLVLLLFFSKAEKKRIVTILCPIVVVVAALFMAGYKNAGQGAMMAYAIGRHDIASIGIEAPVYTGLKLASRVLGYVGLGLLAGLTTPPEDLALSLMHQLKVKPKFAYGVLAAYHLIPTVGQELEDARLAYKVRGLPGSRWSLRPFFAAMVNCIRWSENLAMAMESKGFDGDGARTACRTMTVRGTDILCAVLVIVLMAAGMVFLPL